MTQDDVMLRPAKASDAAGIARVLRLSLDSLEWMPRLHTAEEDLAVIQKAVLPNQAVTVAEAHGGIVGFIAVRDAWWIDLLYLDPAWTGRGIGSRLLAGVTAPESRLYCFQANVGARRFYERHGFHAEVFSDGARNEERLPDILYVRR